MHRKFGEVWFEEVWNKGRREVIAELMPPEAVLHDAGDSIHGPAEFEAFFDRMQSAFSEMHVTVHSTIAEGDMECYHWSCTMRHTGDGLGFPPTGKECRITGISVVRFAGDKFAEGWQNWDMLGLMQQLRGEPKAMTYLSPDAAE
jgi:predicted ester cyclase